MQVKDLETGNHDSGKIKAQVTYHKRIITPITIHVKDIGDPQIMRSNNDHIYMTVSVDDCCFSNCNATRTPYLGNKKLQNYIFHQFYTSVISRD